MSKEYDKYLKEHIENVNKAHEWLVNQFGNEYGLSSNNVNSHDNSKYSNDEYDPYDAYFYGNKTKEVENEFNKAWLHHIHNNPHHWQYWVLLEDDPSTKKHYICIEMPIEYIFEMIADWWSFSWKKNNLYEIFNWYDEHKTTMKLHANTRKIVEDILEKIRKILDDKVETGKEIVHRMVLEDETIL